MAKTSYWDAPEARQIGNRLITPHHPHLNGVRVDYIHSDEVKKSRGRVVWADCRLITGIPAFLAGNPEGLFVITFYDHVWKELEFNQKVYLVDHELSHAFADVDLKGEIQLSTVGHDFEEFDAILRRHGLKVKSDIEHIFNTMFASRQTEFSFDVDVPLEDSDDILMTIKTPDREVSFTSNQLDQASKRIHKQALTA